MPSGGGGAIVLLGPARAGLEHPGAVRLLKCASDGCPPWLEHLGWSVLVPRNGSIVPQGAYGVRYFLVGWL